MHGCKAGQNICKLEVESILRVVHYNDHFRRPWIQGYYLGRYLIKLPFKSLQTLSLSGIRTEEKWVATDIGLIDYFGQFCWLSWWEEKRIQRTIDLHLGYSYTDGFTVCFNGSQPLHCKSCSSTAGANSLQKDKRMCCQSNQQAVGVCLKEQ